MDDTKYVLGLGYCGFTGGFGYETHEDLVRKSFMAYSWPNCRVWVLKIL